MSFTKTEYVGDYTVRDRKSGETIKVTSPRTVYRNNDLDPKLVIPAGTRIGNNVTAKTETNLERMKQGKCPCMLCEDENGHSHYEQVEIHHLTAEEIQHGSVHFNGAARDGSVVELNTSRHREKALHNLNHGQSFRKEKVETIDPETGETRREIKYSSDKYHYKEFKEQYWKDRAKEYETSMENTDGENTMSFLDRFRNNQKEEAVENDESMETFQDQARAFRESLQVSNTNAVSDEESNGETTGPEPMERGDEMDAPHHEGQEEEMEMDNDYEMSL